LQDALNGKQAAAVNLIALAGLEGGADALPYFDDAGSFALATLTAAGRTILASADLADVRANLNVQEALSYVAEDVANKGQPDGYASLGSDGRVPSAQLPTSEVRDTFEVANQTAMLALDADKGDIAVRTDQNKTYSLADEDPSVLANWVEHLTPTDAVLSVNGQTGAVALDPDDLDDTSTTNKFASAARIASLINGATGKTTPVNADQMALIDSAASNALKKLTWANLKATLIAAFKAAASNVWVGTSDVLFLTPKSVADASVPIALTSGTTVATDCSTGRVFRLVLGHNATLSNPTNPQDGVTYEWIVKQDATGSRTLAYGTSFDFGPTTPTLSTGANKIDLIVATYSATDSKFIASFRRGS
jgi:hypothetical protein